MTRASPGVDVLGVLLVFAGSAQANACFASTFILAGDLDGDGVPEVLVGDSWGDEQRGCVHLFEGASGEFVRSFTTPEGGKVGHDLVWLGGERSAFASLAFEGRRVDLFDARSGERIRSLSLRPGLPDEEKASIRLGFAGDLDGDGAAELLVHGDVKGQGWYGLIASSDDAGLTSIRRVGKVPFDCRWYSFCVVPQWSAELETALVVVLDEPARLEIREPRSGELRATLLVRGEGDSIFGRQHVVAPLGDLDGDGTMDLALSLAAAGGSLRAISGASGETLWERHREQLGFTPGNAILAYGDPAAGPESGGLFVAAYEFLEERLYVLSARDGAELWRSTDLGGAYIGWELAVGPRSGDRPPLLFASRYSPYGKSADDVFCYELGRGERLYRIATPRRGRAVRGGR